MKRRLASRSEPGLVLLVCGHATAPDAIPNDVAEIDCGECTERSIPATVSVGRRTPTFTVETVPPGLLRTHRTNAWAELVVIVGLVAFTDHGLLWEKDVHAGERVVIVPHCDHLIEPSSDAEFYVQFYDSKIPMSS